MNRTKPRDTGFIDSFEGSDPELKIRIDRVLYQDRNIGALERISDFLYCKGVCRGARSHPEDGNACCERLFNVPAVGYFDSRRQTCRHLCGPQPRKCRTPHAFEC